jgi:orotate phosphoribosyltransferase
LKRCADLVAAAGGEVVGAVIIVDRMEATTDLGAPAVALVDYPAPANYAAAECPLCKAGVPITSF